jgi:hypothetical protein
MRAASSAFRPTTLARYLLTTKLFAWSPYFFGINVTIRTLPI